MDRNQEVLSLINDAKDKFINQTEKQREINKRIENTLNINKENEIKTICKDYLDNLNTINSKQLKLDQLLESKRIEVESNADIVKILDDAEKTLIKLDEFCKNKKQRNLEKSMITDIMVCYWNAVGIKLQFSNDIENVNTILLLTNHDQKNDLLKNCKIQMNIVDDHFEIIDVEPKSRLEEMKQIESDVKSNGKGLTILIFKLYSHFINDN